MMIFRQIDIVAGTYELDHLQRRLKQPQHFDAVFEVFLIGGCLEIGSGDRERAPPGEMHVFHGAFADGNALHQRVLVQIVAGQPRMAILHAGKRKLSGGTSRLTNGIHAARRGVTDAHGAGWRARRRIPEPRNPIFDIKL